MAVQANILPPRYADARLVARGGMGEVYSATDESLGRTVAVKVLADRYAADESIRKRFTREALAAARLSGAPNTVTIYDVGEWEGRPFIVMEYLSGGSLADVLRRGQPAPEQSLAWLGQAARALDEAHAHGIVHRDVKPANLLLDGEGNVHVADFGVATAAGLDSLTQTGTVLGTAGYLAPEQAEGKPTTAASDRYALGVLAFELLTGSRPFQGESITAEAAAHVHAPIPSASERAPEVPRAADPVFRRALAKDAGERFSSCGELVQALRAAYRADDRATEPIPPAPRRAARPARRSPWPALLGLLALLALGGGIAAAVLATNGNDRRQTSSVRTVTARGTTVHETVTAPPPATTTEPTTTAAATTSGSSSGASLAQQGYQRLRAGDVSGALPLLQQAAQKLQGTNSIAEAYNDYNLAYALAQTSGCSSDVLSLLDRSQQIQGHRKEIDRLRKDCSKK